MKKLWGIMLAGVFGAMALTGQAADQKAIANAAREIMKPEEKMLTLFRLEPNCACRCLAAELEVINETHIPGYAKEEPKYAKAMHVLTCLRMLQALTGQKFYAGTEYRFDLVRDKDRSYWLLKGHKDEVPFFANWMSRDSDFIAPVDAQRKIIEKWKNWLEQNRYTKFAGNHDISFWYF